MKVKKKTFKEFLESALMSEEQEIKEAILNFEKDGLKINCNDTAKLARTISWHNKANYTDYPEEGIGKVCLNDLPQLKKLIERFGELIDIKKKGNLLTISGDVDGRKKSVDIELVAETFLEVDSDPVLEFDQTFEISAKALNDILNDVKTNKDAVLKITTKNKYVEFTNTGKYKFTNPVEAPTAKEGVSLDLGKPFMNAVSNLKGKLQISLKSNYPVKIMEKTEQSTVVLIVAPRVEQE